MASHIYRQHPNHRSTDTDDSTLDDRAHLQDPLGFSPTISEPLFLHQSNSDNVSHIAPPQQAHDPPLMPLFTPVLQDFQNRYGPNSILHQQQQQQQQHRQYPYEHILEDTEGGENLSNDNGTDSGSPPDFHETFKGSYGDGHDDDDDHELDTEALSRRNLLFDRKTGRQSNNIYNSDAVIAGSGLFGSSKSPQTPHSSSDPFTFKSNKSSNGSSQTHTSRSDPSHRRSNPDLGMEHEVPASLMIEMNHQQQDEDDNAGYWNFGDRARRRLGYKRPGMNAAELAMWKWVNVENLDNFLTRVYDYYVGKGIYTILLERCLNLLTFAFVIGFATFLIGCVDYPKLRHSKNMDQILISQCFHQLPTGTFILLLLFAAFWVGQLTRLIYDIPEMVDMCNFYTYLLMIPDADIQTVSWHEVVNRIIKIRDDNPNTTTAATIQTTDRQRMNAHDIANRIMRKENYMVAIFNKELINLSPPVPLLRNRTILTRILEWSLSFCILGYVFDERGQVRKRFLKDTRRGELADGLRRRFQFMGLATILFSPFISIYLMLYFFFRYFEEYHKNPSSIGTRQYTPLAKWKFKEFNELPHLFEARINASYPLAMKYINQFPKEKTILVCRFVAFISGSFAAVLALFTLFDQDLLLGFEITPEKTVFFYLGLFGTMMAVSRGMIPDQTESFDPELLLRGVVEHTHYMPNEWRDKLHTDEVRKEFALLFEYNVVLFLMEFMSLVLTPLILGFSLPGCSEKIVDFFREFTVHVDGVGYVCSFAVFDFKRHGNVKYGAPADFKRDERFISNEGKMEKSFLNFKQNNPDWEPNNPEGSMYLSKLVESEAVPARSRRPHNNHHHRASDHMQPPFSFGQNSTFLRHRGPAVGGNSLYYQGRNLYHDQNRNQFDGAARTRDDGRSEDDMDSENDIDKARKGSGQVPPSTQQGREQRKRQFRRDTGIESTAFDLDDRHGDQLSSNSGFPTNLGDSFVSEIGQSTGRTRTGSGRIGNRGDERGEKGKGHKDDDMSDVENERESQKKGVFGLLNQIYEMNNVTM